MVKTTYRWQFLLRPKEGDRTKFNREISTRFGVPLVSDDFVLTTEKGPLNSAEMSFLDWLYDALKTAQVGFARNYINEFMPEEEAVKSDWFQLRYNAVSAEIRDLLLKSPYASDAEMLWQKSNKRSDPQYFWFYPKANLGRGFDHPCFRVQSLRELDNFDNKPSRYPERRHGEVAFDNGPYQRKWVRLDRKSDTPFDRFLPFMAENGYPKISFTGVVRLWSGAKPNSGFAFAANGNCYCRRDARTYLETSPVGAGISFQPVLFQDAPTDGCEFLDKQFGPLKEHASYYMNNQIAPAEVLRRLKKARRDHDRYDEFIAGAESKPKLEFSGVLSKPLTALAGLKEEKPDRFSKGAKKSILAKCAELGVPEGWRQFLAFSDGVRADRFEEVHSAKEILATTTIKRQQENAPERYVFIASSMSGEATALDISQLNDKGECPVVTLLEDGETIESKWNSMEAFLEELIVDIRDAYDD